MFPGGSPFAEATARQAIQAGKGQMLQAQDIRRQLSGKKLKKWCRAQVKEIIIR